MSDGKPANQYRTYKVEAFPLELKEDDVASWLRSIKGTLRPALLSSAHPSIVPEVWGEGGELTYRLRVPWNHHEYIVEQLQSHIPGLRLARDDEPPAHDWQYAVEIGLANSSRSLDMDSIERMARTIRAPLRQRMEDGERVMLQLVVIPAKPVPLPEQGKTLTVHPTWRNFLTGDMLAGNDEVNDRRKKLEEPQVRVTLRIAAKADTEEAARHLAEKVRMAVASARGNKAYFKRNILVSDAALKERVMTGTTSIASTAQLSLSELLALMAWPVGKEHEPGTAVSMGRHLAPSTIIPREGRGLGYSTMYGPKRPVAMSYKTVRHSYLLGATHVGKTTTMENMAADDMAAGYGVFVVEADGNLFERVLRRVPANRLDDVYMIDLADETRPVGVNVFDQINSRTAIDELSMLIDRMYQDGAKSITSPRMLYNFAHAIADVPGGTFTDLATLMTPFPKNSPQGMWRDYVARQAKDPEVSNYLQAFVNQTPAEQDRMVAPLYNRTWQFMRPEIRMLLGQRTSSFKFTDIVRDNKILLINLGGCGSPIAAQLIGTFMVNAIRQAVNSVLAPKANYLYCDEFETFMGFYTDFDAILDRARKRNLGLVLAHQRLSQLPSPMIDGIMTNCPTKLVFRTSSRNASIVAREFSGLVTDRDFTGLPDFEAIALVGVDGGSAPPVSIKTRKPSTSDGYSKRIRTMSQLRYGRAVADVERDLVNYYVPEQTTTTHRRPRISGD